MTFREIFESYETIAVYGMSKNEDKAAHTVPIFMHEQGYNVIPINPSVDSILNLKAYPSLDEVPDEIEILNVFRPSEQAFDVVKEAVKRHKEKGDIKLIWLQQGIVSEEGKKLALDNGIEFVQNRCMYVEFLNSGFGKKK
ncbi:MAG: CoA-binding protein [Ignavibacteriae bacterium HGW-Ignavibacteriae-1]|jgi:hypothetical protein|nr:MAG: CoA-binding protein [Ignavibacteriae bacterium HGW-Ignavibacteriae-1]